MHEWFMNFGALAAVFAVVAFAITRFLVNRSPAQNADDRQGRAVGFFFVAILAAIVLVVSFFLVLFGVTATIPGWIGCALAGAAFGLLKD
jgi:uncharacterized membrane-anchored protein